MKNLILALLFFQITFLFSQENKGLELIIIDGYTNQPIPNTSIKILPKKSSNKEAIASKTDENGILLLSNTKKKKVKLYIVPEDNRFLELERKFKADESGVLKVPLYPTKDYESKMFALEDSIYGKDSLSTEEIENLVYEESEMPVFNGGYANMFKFIQENVHYPEISREFGEQGTCYIRFIIEPDGKVSHAKVISGPSKLLIREAVRVVRAMPKWKPSQKNGQATRASFILPIKFQLG